jgi:hypothetical protein
MFRRWQMGGTRAHGAGLKALQPSKKVGEIQESLAKYSIRLTFPSDDRVRHAVASLGASGVEHGMNRITLEHVSNISHKETLLILAWPGSQRSP